MGACTKRLLPFLSGSFLAIWLGAQIPSVVAQVPTAIPEGQPLPPGQQNQWSFLTSHITEVNTEALWTPDISLTDSSVRFRRTQPSNELSLGVSYGTIDLDYQPADFDLISLPANLTEDRIAFEAGFKKKLPSALTFFGSGGLNHGYSSYRALWLNEYYRQYFSGVPGYEKVDPRGFNLSAGTRWEYWPENGFLQVDVMFSQDEVPSGYQIELRPPPQIGTELRRTADRLYTTGARLSLENVLTPRLRLLNEFQLADTTDRDPRLAYQGSLNWAIADHWVLRSVVGLSLEEPDFHSASFGSVLEYDWNQTWYFSLLGRYYQDNGETNNPQLFHVAPPALETFQLAAGLRWQSARWSLKLVAGPYYSRYASVEGDIKPFEKLYRDRDWILAQAALSYSF